MLRRSFLKAIGTVVAAAATPITWAVPEDKWPAWVQRQHMIVTRVSVDYGTFQQTISGVTLDGTQVTLRQMLDQHYDLGDRIRISHFGR